MMRQQLINLSWRLIEYKLMYYRPELVAMEHWDKLVIPDDIYDMLEKMYLRLCLELDLPNSLVHKDYPEFSNVKGEGMMEVDLNRPSVQLVLKKYGVKK